VQQDLTIDNHFWSLPFQNDVGPQWQYIASQVREHKDSTSLRPLQTYLTYIESSRLHRVSECMAAVTLHILAYAFLKVVSTQLALAWTEKRIFKLWYQLWDRKANISNWMLHPDDDWIILSKHWQSFPISNLVRELSFPSMHFCSTL